MAMEQRDIGDGVPRIIVPIDIDDDQPLRVALVASEYEATGECHASSSSARPSPPSEPPPGLRLPVCRGAGDNPPALRLAPGGCAGGQSHPERLALVTRG